MERITKSEYKFNLLNVLQGLNRYADVDEILNRLAAYEDTDKTPDEIQHALADLDRYHIAEQEERLVVLPCKVGDTVYVISYCENVMMNYDGNYETGTGAMECPFENDCPFEDCDEGNKRVFETTCSGFFFDEDRKDVFFDHMNAEFCVSDFGKTVFLARADAEAARKEAQP